MSVEEQTMSPDQDVVDPATTDAAATNEAADTSDAEAAKPKRPTHHAVIMRGVVTPIFGLLAVAAIVLGVLNATMWKPSSEITASANIGGSQYIVTDPGVLTLLDENSTLSVRTSSSQNEACVALGASKDVAGWLAAESSHERITGLASWTELGLQKTKGGGQSAKSSDSGAAGSDGSPNADGANDTSAVAFKDSNMWSKVKCGKGSVTLNSSKPSASTVAIIDLGSANAKAGISMHWVRSEVPDFAMPFYLSGGLLAVIAALCASVFAMPPHKRRKRMVEGKATVPAGPSFAEQVENGTLGAGAGADASAGVAASAGRKRRRHASHRRGSKPAPVQEAAETPVIVDPSARNLVADQQSESQANAGDTGAVAEPEPMDTEATSVISQDELQAYFSRLAQEVNAGNADGAGSSAGDDASGSANDNAGDERQEESR